MKNSTKRTKNYYLRGARIIDIASVFGFIIGFLVMAVQGENGWIHLIYAK